RSVPCRGGDANADRRLHGDTLGHAACALCGLARPAADRLGLLPVLPRSPIGARGADGATLARRAGATFGRAGVTTHEQTEAPSVAALRRSGLRRGKRSVRDQLAVELSCGAAFEPGALRSETPTFVRVVVLGAEVHIDRRTEPAGGPPDNTPNRTRRD